MNHPELTGWESRVEPWNPGAALRPGLIQAWAAGRAPFVRVLGVDVLRISDVIADRVLAVLHERGVTLGPALINVPRRCVELLVPLGSAATWRPAPHTVYAAPAAAYTVYAAPALMRCPAPDVTQASGRWVSGRTWLKPPGADPAATSTDVLAAAVAHASALRRAALTRRIEGWAGDRPMPGPREDQS